MKMALLFILFSFMATQGSEIPSIDIKNSYVVHKKFHINTSTRGRSGNQVALLDPKEINPSVQTYNCTPAVRAAAMIILQDRPNGSEVFVLFEGQLVTALDICHKHDGQILECGDEL